jgi:hypothetical protein|tara:strand:+ start:1681 stop:1800 length:120 start_codon:yes stop_codon:yes gene_type:complete
MEINHENELLELIALYGEAKIINITSQSLTEKEEIMQRQ